MSQSFVNPLTGAPFIELSKTDSTNNYAMAIAKSGEAQHGLAVFSHHQTAGKGQRGKTWQDAPGTNIALSVLLNAKGLLVSSQPRLNISIALAVYSFFSKYALDDTKIKWPNDIYWRDRKAAGILIENIIQGHDWQWCIVGAGINVNQTNFNGLGLNAVSLKQITGKDFNTTQLAKELAQSVIEHFKLLQTTSFNQLLAMYNSVLYKRNEKVTLKKNNVVFDCIIETVNDYGELVTQGALQETFQFGEVEWMINKEQLL